VVEAPRETPQVHARRRAARTGFVALQAPLPKRQRSTGIVRAAAAVLALVLAGAWYVQQQRETVGGAASDAPSAFSA
jgi:hypothetical protein